MTFQPVNVGRARAQGVEFTAEMDVLDWLVAYVNYTFTDTENLDTGDPLRRFARNVVNAGVTAEPVRRLNVDAQFYVVSSQFETSRLHQSRLRSRGHRGGLRDPGPARPLAGTQRVRAHPEPARPALQRGARIPGARDQRAGRTPKALQLGVVP